MQNNKTAPNVEIIQTENKENTIAQPAENLVTSPKTPILPEKKAEIKQSESGLPMKKESLSLLVILLLGFVVLLSVLLINELIKPTIEIVLNEEIVNPKTYQLPTPKKISKVISLPEPSFSGNVSVEEAIKNRRSKRVYSDEPVSLSQLSQILWSAQGQTDDTGHRAAPSARNIYPYNLYVIVRNANGVEDGLYLYDSQTHTLGNLGLPSAGEMLSSAGVQETSQNAPVVIAMAASYAKAVEMFPNNPESVTLLEGGHIGQNIYLQAESMKMATVVTAGFSSEKVVQALRLDEAEDIIYLIPFGHIGEEIGTE